MYKIEKGVVKKSGKHTDRVQKILQTMLSMNAPTKDKDGESVCESFFVKETDPKGANSISSAVSYLRRSYTDFNRQYFTTMKQYNANGELLGVRVWRSK